MTLAEIISIHEGQRPAQTVLMPLGAATVAAHRLASSLQLLSSNERLHVLGVLTDQLAASSQTKPVA